MYVIFKMRSKFGVLVMSISGYLGLFILPKPLQMHLTCRNAWTGEELTVSGSGVNVAHLPSACF